MGVICQKMKFYKDDQFINQFLKESNSLEQEWRKEAFDDAFEAWSFIDDIEKLSLETILEAHRLLMKNLWPEIAGKLRNVDIRVGDEKKFPSSSKVKGILEKWINFINDQDEEYVINASPDYVFPDQPKALRALLHHRMFEKIHPFRDGNGRIGRILYLWDCKRLDIWPMTFRWEDKEGYYELFR